MNPVVPGLGNGLLGDGASSWSRRRAADSSGERWMPLPVSFLWSPLCQADNTLLVLGLNFISVTWSARLAAFPWTSLSVRGHSDPQLAAAGWGPSGGPSPSTAAVGVLLPTILPAPLREAAAAPRGGGRMHFWALSASRRCRGAPVRPLSPVLRWGNS